MTTTVRTLAPDDAEACGAIILGHPGFPPPYRPRSPRQRRIQPVCAASCVLRSPASPYSDPSSPRAVAAAVRINLPAKLARNSSTGPIRRTRLRRARAMANFVWCGRMKRLP